MFSIRRFTLFSILTVVCFAHFSAAQQTERIRSYDSYITVNSDNSMQVRETIDVIAAHIEINHGIYRDYPTRYQDESGNSYTADFNVVSVTRDGKPELWHTSDTETGVRVYIGDPLKLVPEDPHQYVLTYRRNRPQRFSKDQGEFYWNVTGSWVFPIDVVTATVVLPPKIRDAITQLNGHIGDEEEKSLTVSRDKDGNPVFRAENLLEGQGLTIRIVWSKELMEHPAGVASLDHISHVNFAGILR